MGTYPNDSLTKKRVPKPIGLPQKTFKIVVQFH